MGCESQNRSQESPRDLAQAPWEDGTARDGGREDHEGPVWVQSQELNGGHVTEMPVRYSVASGCFFLFCFNCLFMAALGLRCCTSFSFYL